jgi:hypothetical protein
LGWELLVLPRCYLGDREATRDEGMRLRDTNWEAGQGWRAHEGMKDKMMIETLDSLEFVHVQRGMSGQEHRPSDRERRMMHRHLWSSRQKGTAAVVCQKKSDVLDEISSCLRRVHDIRRA